ncbi:MAG: hypothetical protein ABJA35_12700 [Parafilimonas sp.]
MTRISRETQVEILQNKLLTAQLTYTSAVEEGECFYMLEQIEKSIIKIQVVLSCLNQISLWEEHSILAEVYNITAESQPYYSLYRAL